MGRYDGDRRSLPSICLAGDVPLMSCIANDYGWEHVFSRALEGIGQEGDLLLAFSTSGNSANVIRALKTAHRIGVESILLSGESGGNCAKIADHLLLVPSTDTARIQEMHTLIYHTWLDRIEFEFTNGKPT